MQPKPSFLKTLPTQESLSLSVACVVGIITENEILFSKTATSSPEKTTQNLSYFISHDIHAPFFLPSCIIPVMELCFKFGK